MEKQFITAQEANEKAKAYSNMERICEQIERAAEIGCLRTFLRDLTPKDKAKLEVLGYTVKELNDFKYPIVISWE